MANVDDKDIPVNIGSIIHAESGNFLVVKDERLDSYRLVDLDKYLISDNSFPNLEVLQNELKLYWYGEK